MEVAIVFSFLIVTSEWSFFSQNK